MSTSPNLSLSSQQTHLQSATSDDHPLRPLGSLRQHECCEYAEVRIDNTRVSMNPNGQRLNT